MEDWYIVAEEVGHPALLRFARRLQKYRHGILSHCIHRMSTGKLEGVNNKIKVIKRTGYGFHDLDYFTLKVKQAFPGKISTN